MLGGLGLLLGTLGLAAVLLRNVLERRRELALLRAVGYNSSHFTLMVIAENVLLLFSGLVTGTVCALLAIAPVFFERGGQIAEYFAGLVAARGISIWAHRIAGGNLGCPAFAIVAGVESGVRRSSDKWRSR